MGKESRGTQVSINIEPTLYTIANRVAALDGISLSMYGRNLIIADLMARGELDAQKLADILTGRTVDKLMSLAKAANNSVTDLEHVAT